MPRRLPAVYDPVNGKLYGEDPIVGLLEVATGGGGGGATTFTAGEEPRAKFSLLRLFTNAPMLLAGPRYLLNTESKLGFKY